MVYQPNFVSIHGPYQSPIRERNGWVLGYRSGSLRGSSHTMPGWMELHQRQKEGKRKGYQRDGKVNGRRAPSTLNEGSSLTSPTPSSIRFLDLPSEIRLRVYDLLVQRGCIFAFRSFYKGKHVCAASKIIEDGNAQSHDKVCSLMRANHQIKDEVCSVLYGDNTFVFKIGGENYSPTKLQMTDGPQHQVWAKVFNSEAKPLWPLTRDTIRYVRFLIILVQPFVRASRQNYDKVRESVERATGLIKGASQLKRLDISLRAPAAPTFTPETDVVVEKQTPGGLSAVIASNITPQPSTERLQYVLESFSALHNIKNVTFDGNVCPTFTKQLKSIMTNSDPTELPRSSLANKRKRVLGRKRSGYSKRRRVDVPVLDYWRPTRVWSISSPGGMTQSVFQVL